MATDERYLVLLRRELTQAQARLKRAERERDALLQRSLRLEALLAAHGIEPPSEAETPEGKTPEVGAGEG